MYKVSYSIGIATIFSNNPGILNDDEARLIVTDMVMTAFADRDAFIQVVTSKQRLAHGQHFTFTGQLDAQLLSDRTRSSITSDQVVAGNRLFASVAPLYMRDYTITLILEANQFASESNVYD
jgi:hypothetical protein